MGYEVFLNGVHLWSTWLFFENSEFYYEETASKSVWLDERLITDFSSAKKNNQWYSVFANNTLINKSECEKIHTVDKIKVSNHQEYER